MLKQHNKRAFLMRLPLMLVKSACGKSMLGDNDVLQ